MRGEIQNAGSSTAVIEAVELHPISFSEQKPGKAPSIAGRSLRSITSPSTASKNDADRNETLPSPTTAVEQIETFRSPAINMYRIPATFWAFTLMGMNDATYGAIIPYLEEYYSLSYIIISLVFLSPFVGYNLSAILNNSIHMKFGRRGISIMGPMCHIIAYIIVICHPPFPVLVVSYIFAGFGNGILVSGKDSSDVQAAADGISGRSIQRLGRRHGRREPSPRLLTRLLRSRRNDRPVDRDDDDHEGLPSLVLLVLHNGTATPPSVTPDD